jgi:hypothetical protein
MDTLLIFLSFSMEQTFREAEKSTLIVTGVPYGRTSPGCRRGRRLVKSRDRNELLGNDADLLKNRARLWSVAVVVSTFELKGPETANEL